MGWEKRTGREQVGEMREWDDQDVERTGRESKERGFFIEGAIMGLVRNLTLGKFPGIQKHDPS